MPPWGNQACRGWNENVLMRDRWLKGNGFWGHDSRDAAKCSDEKPWIRPSMDGSVEQRTAEWRRKGSKLHACTLGASLGPALTICGTLCQSFYPFLLSFPVCNSGALGHPTLRLLPTLILCWVGKALHFNYHLSMCLWYCRCLLS